VLNSRPPAIAFAGGLLRPLRNEMPPVLYVDKDFDLIAGITGQETHRLQ
jgi:hypothetical protein